MYGADEKWYEHCMAIKRDPIPQGAWKVDMSSLDGQGYVDHRPWCDCEGCVGVRSKRTEARQATVQPRCNPEAITDKPVPIRKVDTLCLDVAGDRWLASVTP